MGVVVIGRNEGERLRRCLESLRGLRVVYVDSGSRDGSVELARALGAEVVALDMTRAFTAARARNEGLARLQEMEAAEYVQFVDGDCELNADWLQAGRAFLDAHREYAAVMGRLRERHREATIYNRLCDMEWDGAAGDVESCGGVAMYRVDALVGVGGFNAAVIAGEEPELGVRLRRAGGKLRRLACDMGMHDAAMTRFWQWWRRAVRAGYAFAMGAWMHGRSPERHWVREVRSIWVWGLLVPAMGLGLAWPTGGLSLTLWLGYALLALRVYGRARKRGLSWGEAWLYAGFCLLAKFAGVQGMARFWRGRVLSRPATIMEYQRSQEALHA